ncbi:WD repeat-containing protein 44 [Elysia marginata]|uniref:WD repeat-containing protein 44 n=1 Tax=Elysia marginata TaxID=1093978 RepID=A0AAV4ER97_9GAST|nr:WD repeat-containing protein 44 [Elysia marginata]
MSSGSDHDDFYDAADETPSTSFASESASKAAAAASLSELEEEERRLLQLKRRAEERRRHEDEELEHRLAQLQQQKRVSAGFIKGLDQQDLEQEGRRRKLEEMRQALGTDGSFSFSTSIDSSQETDSPNTSGDVSNAFALSALRPANINGPKSHTIEKMENNGVQNHSYRHHAKKRSGSWGDLPKNDTQIESTGGTAAASAAAMTVPSSSVTQALDSSLLDGGRRRISVGRQTSRTSIGRDSPRGSLGRDASLVNAAEDAAVGGAAVLAGGDKLNDLDQNMDWYPEKEKQNKSLTLLMSGRKLPAAVDQATDSVVDTILQQTQVNEDSEPDIVKSTKTRTPPSTLKPPVAPPRRKKLRNIAHGAPSTLPVHRQESPESEFDTSSMLLRREPPSPKLGGCGRENTLDVKTVLEGSRYIVTDSHEAEDCSQSPSAPNIPLSGGGSGGGSSPRGASASSHVYLSPGSKPTAGFGADTMDSNNLDSLSMQIKNWQRLGDSGREASPNRRPRSNSGRLLSDEEILELVTVRNLDTGETIPLSTAEDKLPKCVNPLALHIMRRTKEYSSDTSLHVDGLSDESDSRSEKSVASSSNNVRKKGARIKKLIGKTVNRVKSAADSALSSDPPLEEEVSVNGKIFKIKASSKNKGPYDFSQPNLLQDLSGEHTGAIWVMKFSPCGKLLATGGQDTVLRIWVLKSTSTYFEDFRQKYADVRLSPAVSHESLNSASSADTCAAKDPLKELYKQTAEEELMAPFQQRPFCVYKGHSADLLDLSWSKNYFILSSSMDKTVRLWHISRRECLCTFQHIDFVTAIVFHPKDDRYFLSGALDGKLRLWNIPDKKVTLWNELSGSSNLITTANFCHNGRLAVVGTYDGKCIFYTTEQLKYYTMVNVRSTRGKNSRGRKITGIETMPGEEKILVTSNDSRLRMYNLKDLTLSCKYKGCMNNSSQIRASFSPTGKYVVCGSEDHFLYVWKTNHEFLKFTSARRDRNDYWEAIKVHNAVVTSAVFAPNPSFIFRMAMAEQQNLEAKTGSEQTLTLDDDTEEREIIVSADFTGAIKVITNRPNSRSMFF